MWGVAAKSSICLQHIWPLDVLLLLKWWCIYSLSVFLPSGLHSFTTTTCSHTPLFIWELLNNSSHGIFCFSFFFFFNIYQRVERVREDVLEVRERRRQAEDGRREEDKLNSAQRRCRERWKEGVKGKNKTKVLPVPQLQLHHPPSLPSVPTAWSPATPAEVPFSSPQAHSAGFAW